MIILTYALKETFSSCDHRAQVRRSCESGHLPATTLLSAGGRPWSTTRALLRVSARQGMVSSCTVSLLCRARTTPPATLDQDTPWQQASSPITGPKATTSPSASAGCSRSFVSVRVPTCLTAGRSAHLGDRPVEELTALWTLPCCGRRARVGTHDRLLGLLLRLGPGLSCSLLLWRRRVGGKSSLLSASGHRLPKPTSHR
jgi:hypothetical protein